MMTEPQCAKRRCKWLRGSVNDETKQRISCVAFPGGIPDEIAYGDVLHVEPYPGDGGTRYVRTPDD